MAAVAAIFGTAAIALYASPTARKQDGLFSLFRADRSSSGAEPNRAPESYTPTQGPRLDLNDLEILSRFNDASAQLVQRTVPAVVSINTLKTASVPRLYMSPFGGVRQGTEHFEQPGLGSGVIVSPEGHVITNHHVIDGVDEILVTNHDGEQFPARLIGSDPELDVAVLRIETKKAVEFPALRFADSDTVRVGEHVIAIGNPFGLGETVTRGIISARDRRLSDSSNEMFQTDTVINPGNSGGPLVNMLGEIAGINVAIYSGQTDVRVWQGVGLAIPSNSVKDSFDSIMQRGRPIYGHLGVSAQDLPESGGAPVVLAVEPGSPAEKAGLKPGDVLLRFDGRKVASTSDLVRRVRSSRAGSTIPVIVERDGDETKLSAVIGERPVPGAGRAENANRGPSDQSEIIETVGIRLRDLTERERGILGLLDTDPGVIVVGSSASGAGLSKALRRGDFVYQIGSTPIRSSRQLSGFLKGLPKGQEAVLHMIRDGRRMFLRFRP